MWRAPGRVNLIGEHVDYAGGVVLPFACDRETVLASIPNDDEIVLESLDVPGEVRIPLDRPSARPEEWGRYAAGVVEALREAGRAPRGIRGVLSSTVPVGAGLSSSASLAAAIALAILDGDAPPPPVLQRAEHLAVGVPCGVMDQVVVLHGVAGHALAIDCAAVAWRAVPLPEIGFVVVDTGTRRRLDDGRYAARRAELEEALRASQVEPATVSEPGARRLRHVASEKERVRRSIEALAAGDLETLGSLVDASHASLRDDFDVSSPALEAAVAAGRRQPACLGARLIGAGFAGCVLALVRPGEEERFAAAVMRDLPGATAYSVVAADGAGEATV